MVTLDDMYTAYVACRKNKRTSRGAIMFEMNMIRHIQELTQAVNDRTYEPLPSDCFIVTRPRKREIFAAQFRDRVLHHYVALRLEPLFEQHFSDRTFNCRKGKGQTYGINYLKRDIYEVSEGYTKDCYVMTLDISGFFMSINKRLMAECIDRFIRDCYKGEDFEDVRWLCNKMIMQRPQDDCIRKTAAWMWDDLPKNKSLFTNDQNCGLAIGNLFVQLFANWFMNDIDWWLAGICRHGRYVDDIYLVSQNKQQLLDLVPQVRERLREKGLTLNERKFYLQHYTKGVRFCGAIVKKDRVYTANRTIRAFRNSIKKLSHVAEVCDMETFRGVRKLEKVVASVNSYLGLISRNKEHRNLWERGLRKYLCHQAFEYTYIKHRDARGQEKHIPYVVKTKRPYKRCFWDLIKIRERYERGRRGDGGLRIYVFDRPRRYRRSLSRLRLCYNKQAE